MIIKEFALTEFDVEILQGLITFQVDGISLRSGSAEDAIILTQLVAVNRLIQWRGLNAYVSPLSDMGAELPKLKFRLNDGSVDYYWDGADWSVPSGADDWTDSENLKMNFKHYPFNKASVKVKLPLGFASKLSQLVVAYEVGVGVEEDLLLSLIEYLGNVEFSIDYICAVGYGSSINLADEEKLKSYNLAGVKAVYNDTTDPDHINPLGFTFSGGILTLSSPQPVGNELWLLINVKPEAAYYTSQDFVELEKYPAIIIESMETPRSFTDGSQSQFISEGSDPEVILNADWIAEDFRFTLVPIAGRLAEQLRMTGSLRDYIRKNPILRLWASGLEACVIEVVPYTGRAVKTPESLLSGSIEVETRSVEQGFNEQVAYIVEEFKLTLNRRE